MSDGNAGNPLTTTTAPVKVDKGKEPTDNTPKDTVQDDALDLANIQTWDPTTLHNYFSMVIYGRRRSGKTYQLRQFVSDIRKRFTDVYLYSGTAHLQDEDYSYIPEDNRIKGLDESHMQGIIDKQEEVIKFNKNKSKKLQIQSSPLIILDDIIGDPKVRGSQVLNNLYTLGRHVHLSVITLTQEIGGKYGVPRVLRTNCDCVIGFYAHSEVDRKMICQQYASVSDKGSSEGAAYYKYVASEPFTSAVFDLQNIQARKYNEYIYRYKVPEKQPNFIIGDKEKKLKDKNKKIDNIITSKKSLDPEANTRKNISFRTVGGKKKKNVGKTSFTMRLSSDPILKVTSVKF